MYFAAVRGEVRHLVEIDEPETLEEVLEEILYDLQLRGDILAGKGEPQVFANVPTASLYRVGGLDSGLVPGLLARKFHPVQVILTRLSRTPVTRNAARHLSVGRVPNIDNNRDIVRHQITRR